MSNKEDIKAYNAARYLLKREEILSSNREWYRKNKEKRDAKSTEWRLNNKERHAKLSRASHLMRKYGMSMEEYEILEESQNGKCKICDSPCKLGKLSVDHCHDTGRIRGLLCRQCNIGLGKFEDSKKLLKKAIKYLQG